MAPVKLPSFQFYPGDWMKDPALRACSPAARGLWIDCLCLMFESPRRGHLEHSNGQPVTVPQLSRMAGATVKEVQALLEELEAVNVFSRTTSGVIYSRRMARDEVIRLARAEGGHKGGEHGVKGGRPRGRQRGFVETPSETPNDQKQEPQKNPPSSSSSTSSSPSGEKDIAAEPRGRPRDPLWDAIVEATGVDTSIPSKAAHVGKVRKALAGASPPYEAADVFALPAMLAQQTPWASGRKLTVGEIEKHIDLVRNRAKPIPGATGRSGAKPDVAATYARQAHEAMAAGGES